MYIVYVKSRDSVGLVGMGWTRLRAGWSVVRISAVGSILSLLQNARTCLIWGPLSFLISGYQGSILGVRWQGVRFATPPFLVLTLRMSGSIPLLPPCLHAMDRVNVTFTFMCTVATVAL